MSSLFARHNLVLEKNWLKPEDSFVYYRDRCVLYLQFRNRSSSTIVIQAIECEFESEADSSGNIIGSAVSSHCVNRRLLANELLSPPIRVPFDIGLPFQLGTNKCSLNVQYELRGRRLEQKLERVVYIVIESIPLGNRRFFISHKDPEDTRYATALSGLLRKLGIDSFVAEIEDKPGFDIWKQKVEPAIESCEGVVVLWTLNAARKRRNILREITLATQKRKPTIVACDLGIQPPTSLAKGMEYFRFNEGIGPSELVRLADALERMYQRGDFFSSH